MPLLFISTVFLYSQILRPGKGIFGSEMIVFQVPVQFCTWGILLDPLECLESKFGSVHNPQFKIKI